jgi:hypothetical protein
LADHHIDEAEDANMVDALKPMPLDHACSEFVVCWEPLESLGEG